MPVRNLAYQFTYWGIYMIIGVNDGTVSTILKTDTNADIWCQLSIVDGYLCAQCTLTNNNFDLSWNALSR